MVQLDINLKENDKRTALRKFCDYNKLNLEEILFFGDQLNEGGNDYPVIKTGIKCIEVKDQNETLEILKKLL